MRRHFGRIEKSDGDGREDIVKHWMEWSKWWEGVRGWMGRSGGGDSWL